MLRERIPATVAMALLLVTAGCAGLAPSENTETAGAGGAPTPADGEPAGPVEAVQTPTIGEGAPVDNFTALYDSTIDSVVEIRVQTDDGRQGQGSGFVYSGDGYVVTNQHVVGDAEEVSVGFSTGDRLTGTVVGTDAYTDLAVVEVASMPDVVDAMALMRATPEPGQQVAAFGSPLGFQGSITGGIVSGVNRSMPVQGGFSIPDTVQTDAAINPGNSGGPLVSMNGTVVGVNRARTGENIGFAVSADVVRRVVPELIANGSYEHSYLGIRTVPVTSAIAEANDLEEARGLMVVGVLEDGPADGALQPGERQTGPGGQAVYVNGDVIVGIDGESIASHHELARYLLFETQAGEEIEVTVLRDGERVTETLTLGDRPAPAPDEGV